MNKVLMMLMVVFGAVSTAQGQVIFDDSFAEVVDGPISGAPMWEGQPAWTVSSGMAQGTGNWSRTRRFGSFRVEDTESFLVKLTDFASTGPGNGGTGTFRVGAAATPEHTGVQTPQVGADLTFDGSTLSFGGASDTGYNSGDLLDLEFLFTRAGSDWTVDTTINNTTDATTFMGSDTAVNLEGQFGDSNGLTAAQWMDANPANELLYGMRMLNNAGGDVFSVGGVSVEVIGSGGGGLLGDFDNDGDVDLDDLDQYNGNIGVAATGALENLDLNEDGTVGADDFMQHYSTLVETSNGGKGTAAGDVNLDGVVNVLGDAFALVGNLNNAATSWSQGDLNADGTVNVLGDAFLLVANLGADNGGGGSAPSTSTVPEPGSLSLLALAGLSALAQRRRS